MESTSPESAYVPVTVISPIVPFTEPVPESTSSPVVPEMAPSPAVVPEVRASLVSVRSKVDRFTVAPLATSIPATFTFAVSVG